MSEQVELSSQSLLDIEYEEEDLDFTETSAQEQHARKRPRVWLVVVIILLVIVLVLGGLFYWLAHRTPSVRYTQAYVTTGTIAQQISATGPIKAKAEYDMNFTSSGQVKTIDVKVGDQVKAGQQLATITPTNAQQNNNSSVTTLTAPADATVAALNGYVGMSTGSGSGSASGSGGSSTGAFIVLTDTSALQITAQVNESDIGNVKVGQSAQFTVPAYPNATLKATVATIETIGQSNSGVVTYPVDLTVDMTSLSNVHLLPAMTATVNITTAQQTNALRVPAAALTFETTALQQGLISRTNLVQALRGSGGQGSNSNTTGGTTNQGSGQHGVVLELQNGQLTPVLVTTGLSNGQFTQILSGLNEGDQVVTGATGGSIQSTTGGATGAQGGFGGAGGFGGGFGGGGGRFGGGGNGGGGRSGGGGNAGGGAGGQ